MDGLITALRLQHFVTALLVECVKAQLQQVPSQQAQSLKWKLALQVGQVLDMIPVPTQLVSIQSVL
ncbi:hypothetical protein D3C72_2213620 [compost metagenome]